MLNFFLTQEIPWSKEEDARLNWLVSRGASWDQCARYLPGRSESDCHRQFEEGWQFFLRAGLKWAEDFTREHPEIAQRVAQGG